MEHGKEKKKRKVTKKVMTELSINSWSKNTEGL
jgi:hypothetical protein